MLSLVALRAILYGEGVDVGYWSTAMRRCLSVVGPRVIKALEDPFVAIGALDFMYTADVGRDGIEDVLKQHILHAPDRSGSEEDLLACLNAGPDRVKVQACRCVRHRAAAGICVDCDRDATGFNDKRKPPEKIMGDGARRRVLKSILKGRVNDGEWKLFKQSIPLMSTAIQDRVLIKPRIARAWLTGRRDLLPIVDLLVDVSWLGMCAFETVVTVACVKGLDDGILQGFSDKHWFRGCHKCISGWLKDFKLQARKVPTNDRSKATKYFAWQYADQLLGRWDDDVLADFSDMTDRSDPSVLYVDNLFRDQKERVHSHFLDELSTQGNVFGECLVTHPRVAEGRAQTVDVTALMSVPNGSVQKRYVPQGLVDDGWELDATKKLALAYMTPQQYEGLMQHAKLNEWSIVELKRELGKLRNLGPGSLAKYCATASVCQYAESAFLKKLDDVPMMHPNTEQRRRRQLRQAAGFCGYTAARDYINWNKCHMTEEFRLFYQSALSVARIANNSWAIQQLTHIVNSFDKVGVVVDGKIFEWLFGLQSGWRDTMLFNTVLNHCAGYAAEKIVHSELGWSVLMAERQGDDGDELNSNVLLGPLMQALLDADGKCGGPQKQHFSAEKGSWTEFLRVYQDKDITFGCDIRAICSFVSSDTQSSARRSGPEQLPAIVESLNTIYRRCGSKWGLRKSDVANLLDYWSTCEADHKEQKRVPWQTALMDSASGGLDCVVAAWPKWRVNGSAKFTVEMRKSSKSRVRLENILKKKLPKLSRLPLGEFASEYAEEFLESVGEKQLRLESVTLGREHEDGLGESSDVAEAISRARTVIKQAVSGRSLRARLDDKAEAFATAELFAGSKKVAKAYIKRYGAPGITGSSRAKRLLVRGIGVLAGQASHTDSYPIPFSTVPSEWTSVIAANWAKWRLSRPQCKVLMRVACAVMKADMVLV